MWILKDLLLKSIPFYESGPPGCQLVSLLSFPMLWDPLDKLGNRFLTPKAVSSKAQSSLFDFVAYSGQVTIEHRVCDVLLPTDVQHGAKHSCVAAI